MSARASGFSETFVSRRTRTPLGENAACVIMIGRGLPPPVFNRREYFMPQTLFSGNGRRSLSRIAAARWGRILSRTSCKKSPQDVKEQFATGATSIHSLSPLNALCRFESCVGDQIDRGGGRAREREGMTGNTPDKSKDTRAGSAAHRAGREVRRERGRRRDRQKDDK